MEPKHKNLLLVMFFWCIIFFNSTQAICVPRNQSGLALASASSPSSSLKPSHSSLASAPVSSFSRKQPPPSPPVPSPASTLNSSPSPKQSPSFSAPKLASTPQDSSNIIVDSSIRKPKISFPTLSTIVGADSKTVSDPQIKSLCDKTDKPTLCLATIGLVFNGKTDIMSVIEMLIKSITDQTKQAIATATKMASDPKYSDAKSVPKFNDCKEIYDEALDDLQEALDSIPAKDIGTISTMLSGAISDYGTCDDGFTGQPNPILDGVSPMAKINENLMDIAGIILSLANRIP